MKDPNEPGIVRPFNPERALRQVFQRGSLVIAAAIVLGGLAFIEESLLIVPSMKVAILIKKTGDDLPDGQIIATRPEQKGIQYRVTLEGWHFYNAYTWDWIIVDQAAVPPGKVGVRVRRFGSPLPAGQVLANSLPQDPTAEDLEGAKQGVLRDVMRPGRYPINVLAEEIALPYQDAIIVPPGHVGVVNLVAGSRPENPNVFVVQTGEQGIQPVVVNPGTSYVNPYERRIYPVDLRSHRFDGSIEFPSQDGFRITLEGTMEWAIDPNRVPEVFMKYVDTRDVMVCIVEKVILPSARTYSRLQGSKHLARDFISGETRLKFQEEFTRDLTEGCAIQGILIKSALVRNTTPPEEISGPIRNREIAIRLKEKYEFEKAREIQQKELAMAKRMEDRKTRVKSAEADVSVATTKAEQDKEVAIIAASRRLEVAQRELESARNDAGSQIARGQASADVIKLKNTAEATGLKDSSAAFGTGNGYVQYLLNQRLAPAIRSIMSNTEGQFADIVADVFRSGAADKEGGSQ